MGRRTQFPSKPPGLHVRALTGAGFGHHWWLDSCKATNPACLVTPHEETRTPCSEYSNVLSPRVAAPLKRDCPAEPIAVQAYHGQHFETRL